jgi:H+/Cl- antiporter ClcA
VNHVHIRIHRWVIWWLCLGVVFGAIALVNILFRELTRAQDKVILFVGIVHWVLGGVVCWAFEGVKITSLPPLERHLPAARTEAEREWHSASDFVQPGNRKRLLPPRF